MLLLTILLQACVGVYIYATSKQITTRLEQEWRGTSADVHTKLQHDLQCCGFKAVSEDPGCRESATQVCEALLSGAQKGLFQTLSMCSLVLIVLEMATLLLAYYLAKKYGRRTVQDLASEPLRNLAKDGAATTMGSRISPIRTPNHSPVPQ